MRVASEAWPEVSLGEVCEFKYGKSLPEAMRSGGDVPVFGSNGIVGSHNEAITAGATIIVGRKGSFGEVNFSFVPCWPIDTTYYLDQSTTDADLRWLSHRLAGLGLTHLNKAAAVPGLNRDDAYRQRLLLPSLAEQQRIAQILDRAEALRTKRRAALVQIDSLTKSVFLDLFSDPATNPRGWPCKTVGALASKFSDGPFGSNLKSSHYTETGIRVIRLQNIGVGEFVNNDAAYISEQHFAELKKHECRPGDVLVGTLGEPNLRACIQPEWLPVALNKADCIQIRPDERIANASYLCALLNQPATERMAKKLIVGQTRLRISMGRLRGLEVPVPPVDLQLEFARRFVALEKLKAAHRVSLAELDALFAVLRHRAFQGELERA
jgi:type I restriction enzyme S subunit